MLSISLFTIFLSIAESSLNSFTISTLCTVVNLFFITSWRASWSLGYPEYPKAFANLTTVDSLTPTASPNLQAVINATLS